MSKGRTLIDECIFRLKVLGSGFGLGTYLRHPLEPLIRSSGGLLPFDFYIARCRTEG